MEITGNKEDEKEEKKGRKIWIAEDFADEKRMEIRKEEKEEKKEKKK